MGELHVGLHSQLVEGLMGVPGGPAVAGFAAGLMHVVAGEPLCPAPSAGVRLG
jgi:hypothetical protein